MSQDTQETRTVAELKARASELGVEDDPRVTRTSDHRPRKADWIEVVREAEADETPSQNEMIRRGLVQGLSNQEISDRVMEVHPDASIEKRPATRVGALIHAERSRASDWWLENRDQVAEHRPRIKLATPAEEVEAA